MHDSNRKLAAGARKHGATLLDSHGIRPFGGDEFIHFGILKDFVDGGRMFAPLANNGSFAGNFTFRFVDEATTQRNIVEADRAGFDIGFHVIGDCGRHAAASARQDVVTLARNLGPERAKNAFAWRTMIEGGVRVNIVSDMPGVFNKSDVSPFDLLRNIYSAVTRRDPSGVPGKGWYTEQCLTVEEASRVTRSTPPSPRARTIARAA